MAHPLLCVQPFLVLPLHDGAQALVSAVQNSINILLIQASDVKSGFLLLDLLYLGLSASRTALLPEGRTPSAQPQGEAPGTTCTLPTEFLLGQDLRCPQKTDADLWQAATMDESFQQFLGCFVGKKKKICSSSQLETRRVGSSRDCQQKLPVRAGRSKSLQKPPLTCSNRLPEVPPRKMIPAEETYGRNSLKKKPGNCCDNCYISTIWFPSCT